MYKDLRQLLPRDFRAVLSGVRGYAEGALDYQQKRRSMMADRKKPLAVRKARVDALRQRVEELSVILFTYALYLRFLSGDEAIKSAVAAFESLEVEKVQIGSMALSRDSKYYDMGLELATKLAECIHSRELHKLFKGRCHFYEVVEWYKREKP